MFLLIQHHLKKQEIMQEAFKFHYVSINSQMEHIIQFGVTALNSIMFLLILLTDRLHLLQCSL